MEELLQNQLSRIAICLAIILVTYVSFLPLRSYFRKRRNKGIVWNIVRSLVCRTNIIFVLIVSIFLGSLFLILPERINRGIQTVAIIASLLQLGSWSNILIDFLIVKLLKSRMPENADNAITFTGKNIIHFTAFSLIWLIVFLLCLDNLGFNVTALITGLGVGGIAISLALQNVFADLFASFSILLDKPFLEGDFIVIDDYLGTVEKIGLKTTRVRSLGGELIVVPNKELVESRIRNYKQMYNRRILFEIGVVYETSQEDLQAIPEIIQNIIQNQKDTLFDRCHFRSYADFSLVFEIVYYVLSADYTKYMDVQQAINFAIFEEFGKRGIEFAYPTQKLYQQVISNS